MREQPSFWDYNEKGLYFYKRQAYDLAIAEFEKAGFTFERHIGTLPEVRGAFHVAGANDYLSKPVDSEKLISLLRVWLYR